MTQPDLPTYEDPFSDNETTRDEIVELLTSQGFLTDDAIKYRFFDENPVDAINEYCAANGKVFRDPWFQYLQYDEPCQWTKDLHGPGQHGADPDKEKEDIHELEWARPLAINPEMVMFKDGATVSDAYQGGIGNCGVCAMNTAIQCLQSEPIRTNLYPNEISVYGCYSWKTFRNGKFGYVLFDDLIACIGGSNSPWSWHSTDNLEAWPMFLEKCMAKTNGTYNPWPANGWNRCWEFPRPVMLDAGFVYHVEEHFELHREDDWPFMVEHLGVDAIAAEQFKDVEGTGLVEKHGYACLGAAVVGDLHLLKWRNPWGCAEWTGDWSDESPLWAEHEDVKAACNDGHRTSSADGDRGMNDGAFWMEREDLDKHMYANYLHMIVLADEKAGFKNSSAIGAIVTGPEGSNQVCVRLKHSGGDLLWGAECFESRWTCDDLKLYCDLFHLIEGERQAQPFYSTRGMNRDMGRQDTDHRIHLGGDHLDGGEILIVFGWEVTGECPPAEGESKDFYVRVSSCNRPHELGEIEPYAPYEATVTTKRFPSQTDGDKLTEQEKENWPAAPFAPTDRLVAMCDAVDCSENFDRGGGRGNFRFSNHNGASGWAEYTLGIEPGTYAVYAHYTSADPRPLKLSLDGEEAGRIATRVIGTFGGDSMNWSRAPMGVTVPEGGPDPHTLRLETEGFYPHISSVAFIQVGPDFEFATDEGGEEPAAAAPEEEEGAAPARGPTFFADEAFQLRGSQEDYDAVMAVPEEEREAKYLELKG
mmetsp:Transcript_33470/g.92700  ORF Transcript_33470/g.92700 Transcript_33470/m.92700 type:complete len:757 (-) Transcript_33470:269-2539(-)